MYGDEGGETFGDVPVKNLYFLLQLFAAACFVSDDCAGGERD